MVSLTMMARLLEAVRPDARLVLVGDPDQLASVEAGRGARRPVAGCPPGRPRAARRRTGRAWAATRRESSPASSPRTHVFRFGEAVAALARAVQAGDADEVLALLRSGSDRRRVRREPDDGRRAPQLPAAGRRRSPPAPRCRGGGAASDVAAALAALDRTACCARTGAGPYGVPGGAGEVERWLADAVPGLGERRRVVRRPAVLVTANDYELGLYNGDTGVVVADGRGRPAGGFAGAAAAAVAPTRLAAVADRARDDRAPGPGQPVRARDRRCCRRPSRRC